MPGVHCFTSFTFAYLARARVLAETLKAAHPDWVLHALVVDEFPPGLDPDALAPFDAVTRASALGIERFRAWMFKHDLVEGCTAVKGTMLCRLLAEGADMVVYLDPDVAVFHGLDLLERDHAGASVVLTPHQLAPNEGAAATRDNEFASLRYGIYNLGFVAVRNTEGGHAFAAWWAGVTRAACYDDPAEGIFTDQKYCDLAPAMFEGVEISRDPGCNVASWNLSRRSVAITADGALTANGARLRFYHFTKIGSVGDVMTERYARRNTEVFELVNWYKRRVARHSLPEADAWPWSYAAFDSGERIPRRLRLLWRQRADLQSAFDDPFATGRGTLHDWVRRERPELMEA